MNVSDEYIKERLKVLREQEGEHALMERALMGDPRMGDAQHYHIRQKINARIDELERLKAVND